MWGGGGDQRMDMRREKRSVGRRLLQSSNKMGGGSKGWKLSLGKGASRDVLEERACPTGQSPKRATPMEVDHTTPSKKKKKERKVDSKQKLITEVWKGLN